MSNGAQAAAARKRARAAPISPSRDALMHDMNAPSDVGFTELLFDGALDADGALEAAQISHSQIIERQAETIARLEASAARAKEYKTLTKVKLKEAAQRLKDYRLRVEALMGEVESTKSAIATLESEKKKALAQVSMLKKKQQAAATVVPVVKKPVVKPVAVQTDAKSVRSVVVQTEPTVKTREIQTQTESAVDPAPSRRIAQPRVIEARKEIAQESLVRVVEKEPVKAAETSRHTPSVPVVKETPRTRAPDKEIAEKASVAPTLAATSTFDAISATIDAELDFSDDDSDGEGKVVPGKAATPPATGATSNSASTTTVVLQSLLDDAISREIDAELDFGSSSDSSSSSSSSDDDEDEDDGKDDGGSQQKSEVTALKLDVPEKTSDEKGVSCPVGEMLSAPLLGNGDIDAITSAIDAELASSGDEEDHADAVLDDMLESAAEPLLLSPRLDTGVSVRLDRAAGSPLLVVVPDTGPPAPVDVEMTVMTMPPKSSVPLDDISAALDAELATSSSEDEDETAAVVHEEVELATNISSAAAKPVEATDDVEMVTPTEPEDHPAKPVENGTRNNPKEPEASDDIEMVEQGEDDACDATVPRINATTEIIKPVSAESTLEDVLREKSRALSLTSDSDSSDTSSSSSENDESSESGTKPASESTARSTVPAKQPPSPVRQAVVQVESLWAASIAKKSTSSTPVDSPVRVLKIRNKREASKIENVNEPDAKKHKTAVPPVTEKPQVVANLPQPATAAPTKPVVRDDPKPEIPATTKRDAPPQSALPPGTWASYMITTAPQEGEDVDVAYVTRTLGVLLKHVSFFLTRAANGIGFRREFYSQITKHADVIKLCKMLADEYRHRHVACEVLIEAMTRVLRTPRTRQLVDKSIVVLSVLFRNVLFRRLRLDSNEPCGTGLVSDIHQCLLHLRNLVAAGRIYKGLALPRGTGADADFVAAAVSGTSSSSTKPPAMGHEVAFIAHVCAFHTAICQMIGRSDIARVLLVDVLKCHQNIKGLYCVHAMVQVDPLLLQKRWDGHGNERRSALRAATIHVLLAIAAQSREKQETILYKETASTLLSVVAEAVDEPQLEPVGYSSGRGFGGPSNESIHEFQATLWRDHIVPCVVGGSTEGYVSDMARALELLGALHGDAMMGRHFSLYKFQNLLTTDRNNQEDGAVNADASENHQGADPIASVKIVRLVGALSRGILRSHATDHGGSFFVVDEAVRWMLETWLKDDQDGEDGNEKLMNAVATELIEVLLGMSMQPLNHPRLAQRRDAGLHKLLKWLTPDRLEALPPASLRQLRLLVLAARPLT